MAKIKTQNFGSHGGTAPSRGEDLSGTDVYHHAKFTPIGAAVADITVTGQREKTANLVDR